MTAYISVPVVAEYEAQGVLDHMLTDRGCSDSDRIYGKSPTGRKRRTPHERNPARDVENHSTSIRYTTPRGLDAIQNATRNDDRNRSRRHDPYDYTSSSSTRLARGVDCQCNAARCNTRFTPAIDPVPQQRQTCQPTQPVIPHPPTATPVPECTEVPVLNPFLKQQFPGHEPITFDISCRPEFIAHNRAVSIPWIDQDFNLPATIPSIHDMTITVMVDDPLPKFEWPILVANPTGITCGDVLNAIWTAFHRHVSRREYYAWEVLQRDRAKKALYRRWDSMTQESSGMRELSRIDYMSTGTGKLDGGGIMFRGMIPAFDVSGPGGWLMFVGSSGW